MSANKDIKHCELAEDVKDGGKHYVTINRKKKRSDKYCPRCNAKAVNKTYRRCDNCQGRLLWHGDDAETFNENMDYWFMWTKTVFGLEGWYSKDYWDGEFDKQGQRY